MSNHMTRPSEAEPVARKCLICGAASLANCAGGCTSGLAEPCGPFVRTTPPVPAQDTVGDALAGLTDPTLTQGHPEFGIEDIPGRAPHRLVKHTTTSIVTEEYSV